MRETWVGRVLAASLHQAIADVLPTRLGYYEHWLHVDGLRGGTIGPVPLQAVLSFLRQDGDTYDVIVSGAGAYAAEWTVASMSAFGRRVIRALPVALRRRVLLALAARLVRTTWRESRATMRKQAGIARVSLANSFFCAVREPATQPLCGYYRAAYSRLLELFDIRAQASIVACAATGGASCVLEIPLTATLERSEEEAATA
jgi:bacteriochlorophyll 4-vinyl reductase